MSYKSIIENLLTNRSKLLAFNTATNLFTHFIALLVGIIVLPIKLNYFGTNIFGIFILVTSLLTYLQRVDFGIGSTMQRYTANLLVREKYKDLRCLLGFGFAFNSMYGLLIALILFLIGSFSDHLFSLEPENNIIFRQLITIVAIRSIISWPLSIFNTFLAGAQYFFFINAIGLINIIGDLVIILWTVSTEATIVSYLISVSVIGISTRCIVALHTMRKFPFAKPSRFRWNEIKGFLSFSIHMLKSQFSSIIQFETDRILIGIFLNAQSLTYYHIGERLHGMVRHIFNNFTKSMTPLMAEKYAANDKTYIRRAVYDGSRIISILWFPIIATLMINAENIIRIWLGPEYAFLHLYAAVFLIPYFINIPSAVMNRVLIGSGEIRQYMNTRVAAALVNLTISIVMIQYYGIWGVLIGTLCQSTVFGIYFYRFYFNFIDIQFNQYFQNVILPCVYVAAGSITTAMMVRHIWTPNNIGELGIVLTLPLVIGYSIAALHNRNDITFVKRLIFSH